MHDHDDKALVLTVEQAARRLQVSPRTLYSLTAPRGPIAVVRMGPRTVRYREVDLIDYLARAAQPK